MTNIIDQIRLSDGFNLKWYWSWNHAKINKTTSFNIECLVKQLIHAFVITGPWFIFKDYICTQEDI